MRSLMRAFATALAILLAMTAVRPGPAHAAAPDPEPEPEAEVAPAPVPKPPKVDGLGRVFPDPFQLRRARAWTGGGVVLTATGAALVLTGLTLVSSFARGELATPVGGS